MVIVLTDLLMPSTIGAITGLLVVFLVLKNMSLHFKIKTAIGGFISALIVAALYFVSQNILIGVMLGVSWAYLWLFIIAHEGSKNMPDLESTETPSRIALNSPFLSGMMLTIIVFILGSAASVFSDTANKFPLVAFSAPPLLGAMSFVTCTYFITRLETSFDVADKQKNAKKIVMWWGIGQAILISTVIAVSFFVAFVIQKLVV